MENIGSIKILGSGTIPKGNYDIVSVIGEAQGTDAFSVNFLKVIGQLIAHRSVEAEDVKILGEMICNENSSTNNDLEILGRLTAKSYYKADTIRVYGQGFFKDVLEFNEIDIIGELEVKKNCKGNKFLSTGKFNISGILSCDLVKINPKGTSFIKEINAHDIRIRNKNLFNFGDTVINSDIIYGNKVQLENTNCKLVKGNDVIILESCNIERVEYNNSIFVSDGSRVKEKVKVDYISIEEKAK